MRSTFTAQITAVQCGTQGGELLVVYHWYHWYSGVQLVQYQLTILHVYWVGVVCSCCGNTVPADIFALRS